MESEELAMNKILSFVINEKNEFLLLLGSDKDPQFKKSFWYVVTGGCENEDSSLKETVKREIKEETGLTVTSYQYKGIVTFVSDEWGTEYMHLFRADEFAGEIIECDEGELEWIAKEDLLKLPMWEGDKIFLELLDSDVPFFSLKLKYSGDVLTAAVLNGKEFEV